MRKLIIALSVMAAVVNAGGETSVVAVNGNAGVYEHEMRVLYETPLFVAGKDDRLEVLEHRGRFLKVQNQKGEQGWIEKRLTKKVSSRGFVFENAQVRGYGDNPEFTIIQVGNEPPEEAIRLNRSFKECLTENLDRETADRIVK